MAYRDKTRLKICLIKRNIHNKIIFLGKKCFLLVIDSNVPQNYFDGLELFYFPEKMLFFV